MGSERRRADTEACDGMEAECGTLRTPQIFVGVGALYLRTGVRSAADILDVWTHPLLSEKWKDVVASVQFLTPPAPIIIAGQSAPIHVQRNIAIINL